MPSRDSRLAADVSRRLQTPPLHRVPVDNFFEGDQGTEDKQPYAIAMKFGEPFALADLENWKIPLTEECAHLLHHHDGIVGEIHDRMDYRRCL